MTVDQSSVILVLVIVISFLLLVLDEPDGLNHDRIDLRFENISDNDTDYYSE